MFYQSGFFLYCAVIANEFPRSIFMIITQAPKKPQQPKISTFSGIFGTGKKVYYPIKSAPFNLFKN